MIGFTGDLFGRRTKSKMETRRLWQAYTICLVIGLYQCPGVQTLMPSEDVDNDFRVISYKDLLPTSHLFMDKNVTAYSQLLFDVARKQLIVGARDTLYRLSFTLDLYEKASWQPGRDTIDFCLQKGKSEEECRNYIRVLHSYGNQLFTCGTHAFNPSCTWRQMEDLSTTRTEKGIAKCPFNPLANVTSIMTDNGQLYVGSPTDFSGSDPAIVRVDVKSKEQRFLRTVQYDSKWLNEPQFVGSFESGDFIYFVFRETAIEYINCGKAIYSRIARVCKSDSGGDTILRDNWTTFLKARLNCSLPGEYPFYFNEIQGIAFSAEENVLYATFTTPENSIHGSAVCAFNMSAINTAFDGPFKFQDSMLSAWSRRELPHRPHHQCRTPKTYNQVIESSKYQLMDYAVQPVTLRPLYYSKLEKFQHIAIDSIATKLHESVRMIFVSTVNGQIKKLSILPRTKESCIIEIWNPAKQDNVIGINTIQYLKSTESLYIGSSSSILKIPAQHCNRHVSRETCLNSMDPYCGWNEVTDSCTPPPGGDPLTRYWVQNATMCPILTAPIDGGWSAWSDWFKCGKNSENLLADPDENGDSCLCRTRACVNPSPRNGGSNCKGISTTVINCTVHGEWTDWSPWSACSQTCGMAVKTRRRTCGNPKPAHGGRVCVGPDSSEMYCSHLPPCPVAKQPSVDGGWGPWGQWSACSVSCGGGFRLRRRECNDPPAQNGGQECPGCHVEYEPCNPQQCTEYKKTYWTPWISLNDSLPNGAHSERRFRYTCKAITIDPSSLKLSNTKEEKRVCMGDGQCQRYNDDADEPGWEDWGPWSTCTVSCGGGQQYRTKNCLKGNCDGNVKMARACNTQPCTGEWGCWGEWSECSVTCGVGKKSRKRTCLAGTDDEVGCEGPKTETKMCEMPVCDYFLGWSKWSEWSNCTEDGYRERHRICEKTDPGPKDCQGSEKETRACLIAHPNDTIQHAGIAFDSWPIAMYLVLSNIIFITVSALITWKCTKDKYSNNVVKAIHNFGSPCYDTPSVQQNQYITLPTHEPIDRKVKRQPSFNKTTVFEKGNGTLTKPKNINHTKPKAIEYEAATIKRNSQGLNNAKNINRSIDQENFY